MVLVNHSNNKCYNYVRSSLSLDLFYLFLKTIKIVSSALGEAEFMFKYFWSEWTQYNTCSNVFKENLK